MSCAVNSLINSCLISLCEINLLDKRMSRSLYRQLSVTTGSCRPVLLKNSALVTAVEKLAPEIEILKVGRGLRAQISRSNARKRRFHRSRLGPLGQTDFFNRIGQRQTLSVRLQQVSSRLSTYRSSALRCLIS